MEYRKLQGKRFGKLVVVAFHGYNKWKIATWFCECDCGGTKVVPSGSLVGGYTKSCGCYGKEHPSHTKHGGRGTRLYNIWKSMNERCNTVTCSCYKNYGERGIKVCDEWKDYRLFYSWSIENNYSKKLTIDRIDNNGNYEPSNCRWATLKQQARNTRRTVYYEIDGIKKPMIEWCEILNKPYSRVHQRYCRGIDPFGF